MKLITTYLQAVMKGKCIYILSPEPWGTNFVSKHHYASLLSENNEVYFFNPPSNRNKIFDIKKGLKIVDYSLPKGINRMPRFLRVVIQSILAKRLMQQRVLPNPDIIWSFDPYVFQDLSVFNKRATKIYHSVDVHQTDLELFCVTNADVVFSTADLILDRFKGMPTPMFQINHGLALHFLDEDIRPVELPGDSHNIKVGYVGNLNYPFMDYETLYKILREHCSINFYFIGPNSASNLLDKPKYLEDVERIKKLDNVFLLGAKPSSELPAYLNKMDAFLMCYRAEENIAHMANPHKILEYLSTGKVVVTHYIDQYKDRSDLIEMVRSNVDLPSLFSKVVANVEVYNTISKVIARKLYAQENTYTNQLSKIETILKSINSNTD